MVKRYKLRKVSSFTSEKLLNMWVRVNDEYDLCYERRKGEWWLLFERPHSRSNFTEYSDACLNKALEDGEAEFVVGPDPFEYTRLRGEEGVSLSAAVKELARICSVSERSVWRWMDGSDVPPYATKLLAIWADSNADQRAAWFHETR